MTHTAHQPFLRAYPNEDFLACLAYFAREAQNPLGVIDQSVRILRQSETITPCRQEAYARIERHVESLKRLILDISEFAEGNLEMRRKRTTVREVWGMAVDLARPMLESKSQALEGEPPEAQIAIEADSMRLAQALSNLLANASKYSPSSSRIWAEFLIKEDQVDLTVRDEGMGISAKDLPTIFDLFDRAEDALEAGTGVGLAIAKRIIELHGGRISAYSDGLGMGSRFVVSLPIAAKGESR